MEARNSAEFRITHEELMELCTKTKRKWSDQTLEVLKAIVVDGESQESVAKRYDVSQQAISKSKARLLKLREDTGDLGFRYIRIHSTLESELSDLLKKSALLFGEDGSDK
jgi:hypothetical protein